MPEHLGERLRRVAVVRACAQLEIAQSVLLVARDELGKLPGLTEHKARLDAVELELDRVRAQVLAQFHPPR